MIGKLLGHTQVQTTARYATSLLVRQSAKPRLTGSVASGVARSNGSTLAAPLTNLVFDTNGHRMTPTYAVKTGRRYRYYVSAPLVRGERSSGGIRVPAANLEQLATKWITTHLKDPTWLTSHLMPSLDAGTASCLLSAGNKLADHIIGSPATKGFEAEPADYDLLQSLIARIVVDKQKITIELSASHLASAIKQIRPDIDLPETTENPVIEIQAHTLRCGKQVKLVIGEVESSKARLDPDLIKLIRDAHRWFEHLRSGRISSIAAIARREDLHVPEVSRSISLAFLVPDLVEMILAGRQPATLTIEKIKACRPLPPDWREQRDLLIG